MKLASQSRTLVQTYVPNADRAVPVAYHDGIDEIVPADGPENDGFARRICCFRRDRLCFTEEENNSEVREHVTERIVLVFVVVVALVSLQNKALIVP